MPSRLQQAPNRFNGKSILHRKHQQQRLQPLAPFLFLPPWPPWTAGPLSPTTAGGRTMVCRRLGRTRDGPTAGLVIQKQITFTPGVYAFICLDAIFRVSFASLCFLLAAPSTVAFDVRLRMTRFNRALSGPTVPAVSAFQYTPIIICGQQQGVAFDGNMADHARDFAVPTIDPNPKSTLFRP